MANITYGGVSSSTVGLVVETYPHINRPSRKFERVSVPGRNGDLFFYQDAYENYMQSYEVYAGSRSGSAQTSWKNIMAWLYPAVTNMITDQINLTVNGYHQLTDGYDTSSIRLATYNGSLDIENSWNHFGRAVIQFNCRPERFTTDAFTMIEKTTTGGYITNSGDQEAKPFIKVYGSGNGTLTVNGYKITITGMTDYLHIDCDSQNCYRQLTENRNSIISLTKGFPILNASGSKRSTIAWTGGVTKVEIYPRWWRL